MRAVAAEVAFVEGDRVDGEGVAAQRGVGGEERVERRARAAAPARERDVGVEGAALGGQADARRRSARPWRRARRGARAARPPPTARRACGGRSARPRRCGCRTARSAACRAPRRDPRPAGARPRRRSARSDEAVHPPASAAPVHPPSCRGSRSRTASGGRMATNRRCMARSYPSLSRRFLLKLCVAITDI